MVVENESLEVSTPFFEENGTIYWSNAKGILHRINGPCLIVKLCNYEYYEWKINGIYHRVGGPAIISKYMDPGISVDSIRWFLDGKEYSSKEDYWDDLSEEDKMICIFSDDFWDYSFI